MLPDWHIKNKLMFDIWGVVLIGLCGVGLLPTHPSYGGGELQIGCGGQAIRSC
jgi:hypothetical protein